MEKFSCALTCCFEQPLFDASVSNQGYRLLQEFLSDKTLIESAQIIKWVVEVLDLKIAGGVMDTNF